MILFKCLKFTLVELLVVISIIGILISMLQPSLSNARRKAQIAVCLNKLSQIGRGLNIYTNDSNSFFPESKNNTEWQYSFDLSVSVNPVKNMGMGRLMESGIIDKGSLFHCPLLDTTNSTISKHSMNIAEDNWWNGVGSSFFFDPYHATKRKITSYNNRSRSFFSKYRKLINPLNIDNDEVLAVDVMDGRFTTAIYGHTSGYNRLFVNGSCSWLSDKAKAIYAQSLPLVHGGSTDENLFDIMKR